MSRHLLFVLLLAAGIALADDSPEAAAAAKAHTKTEAAHAKPEATQERTAEAQAEKDEDAKLISVPGGKALGMSILGNQDAPKSLVIVPWKSSELGDTLGIAPMLDDSRGPVDRDVFMRALSYYEIRSETTRHDGAQAATGARRSQS